MKKIIFSLIVSLLIFGPTLALAEANLDDVKSESDALQGYRQAVEDEVKIQYLQKLGDLMIGQRIWSLALAKAKLDSAGGDSGVVGYLENQFNDLKNLKEAIAGNNDLESLKAEVNSVVTDYQIYRVSLPQAHGLLAVINLENFSDEVGGFADQIKSKTGELEDLDLESVEALLASAEEQVSAAKGYLKSAEKNLSRMEADNLEAVAVLKKEAKSDINEARAALKDAFKSLRLAVAEMKSLVADYNAPLEAEE